MPTGRTLLRLLAGLYTLALVLFAASSILLAWGTDSLRLLLLEVAVDGVFVAGCLLFLLERRLPAWRWVFAGALLGQVALLALAEQPVPSWPGYALELAVVLGPAMLLNVAAAGLLGFSGSIPKRSQ